MANSFFESNIPIYVKFTKKYKEEQVFISKE